MKRSRKEGWNKELSGNMGHVEASQQYKDRV